MVDWPSTLPCTLVTDGNSGGVGDGRIRSATDTGPGKVRRRTTAMAKPITGSLIMTVAEIAILEDFIEDDLMGGTLVFNFKDPMTHALVPMRFGEQLPTWSEMPGKKRWLVNMVLEKLP
jgi:hypothetical protein